VGTIPASPLGKATVYPEAYDAALLYPVERAPQRAGIGIAGDALPFHGEDRWTAWELFWLDPDGRAQVAIAAFVVPCTSPRIVESKSVKLWLTSMNAHRFGSADAVRETMARELSLATGAEVEVSLIPPVAWAELARAQPAGRLIDDARPRQVPSQPDPTRLAVEPGDATVSETLVSHTFRSVCPVTGQPDYATIVVQYEGPRLDPASLATYLAGYRHHPGFHEACVEQIFVDLSRVCTPSRLTLEARFARRGGIDINPIRSSGTAVPRPSAPTLRQ
jgi:7-cyano-7-deazaguanine reductase